MDKGHLIGEDGFVNYAVEKIRKAYFGVRVIILYGKNEDRRDLLFRRLRQESDFEKISVVSGLRDRPGMHKDLMKRVCLVDVDEIFAEHESGKRNV